MEPKPYRAWVISNGAVGRRNQCIGLAEQVPAEITVLKLKDIEAAGGLTNYLAQHFGSGRRIDWPDLVLGSSDEECKTALAIKKLSDGKVFAVATQSRVNSYQYDFMVHTEHTRHRDSGRTETMLGVPHRVTPEFIGRGVDAWADRLSGCMRSERPTIAVLVGGDIDEEKLPFTIEEAKTMGEAINREAKRMGADILLTNSPRISVPAWRALREAAMKDLPAGFVHDCRQTDGNPYPAYLGIADVIAVTGDSISMCFEAAGTGKPVYILAPDSITPELYGQIHGDLYERGLARKFEGSLEPYAVTAEPLNETARVGKLLALELGDFKARQNQRGG